MVKDNTKNPSLESIIKQLEKRVTVLETKLEKKLNRKKKEYTQEERVAIRARLLAGQEAARNRQETETNIKETAKTEVGTTKRTKKVVKTEKPADNVESVTTE